MTDDLKEKLPNHVVDRAIYLGVRIRMEREKRRWDVAKFARVAQLEPDKVSRIEAGDLSLSLGVYMCALWALGLDDSLDRVALIDPPRRTREELGANDLDKK